MKLDELEALERAATPIKVVVIRDGLGNDCDLGGIDHLHPGPFDDRLDQRCPACRYLAAAANAAPHLLAVARAAANLREVKAGHDAALRRGFMVPIADLTAADEELFAALAALEAA